MPELHLKQPEFTYSTCRQFTKHLDRIQSFERAYEIATNSKYDEYQRGLSSMVHKFFDKKARSGVNANEMLAQKLLNDLEEEKFIQSLKIIFGQQI